MRRNVSKRRRAWCSTDIVHRLLSESKAYRGRYNAWRSTKPAATAASSDTFVIRTVVNAVHHTSGKGFVSDARIRRQVAILNECFAAKNDTSKVHHAWKPLIQDSKIRFVLTKVKGQTTTGIRRRESHTELFDWTDDKGSLSIKRVSNGGIAALDRNQYLNIWVGNLASYYGYATFPSVEAAYDGVAVDYERFAQTANVKSLYNLGRTCVHEVGHWLGLHHLKDDKLADTPHTTRLHSGSGPCGECGKMDPPHMFTNFMECSDDYVVQFFTKDQVAEMRATITSKRPGVFT